MRMIKFAGMLLGLGLILPGCDLFQDELSDNEFQDTLRLIVEADEVFSMEGLSDDGLFDDDYDQESALGKATADTLWPGDYRGIRWGRQITSRSWDLAIDELGEDTAYATITATIGGTLSVGGWIRDADSTLIIQDTLTKPFELVTTRRVRFVKEGNSGDLLDDWRIDGLTAVLGKAGSKVSVDTISFSLSDTSGHYFSLQGGEVLSRFFDRSNLPTFQPFLSVKVLVAIGNAGPEFPLGTGEKVVFRRMGRHSLSGRFTHRRSLNDLGLGVDEIAGDNIYSGIWYPRQQPMHTRPFRAFVEVLDLATLFVEEEPFHLEFIGLPYRVTTGDQQRPF